MYSSGSFSDWGIGDVDVVFHEGRFHLFHLVLPNHAYIAHAVSDDGLRWTRVKSALFIGEPGSFDDDMLWTMHVSPDPDKPGSWRMFYTGLSRAERGRVQRIGLALSDDLIEWRRSSDHAPFPLEAAKPYYENRLDEGRNWVSFRDPFFCSVNGERWLLAAGRVPGGPVIRRGCVAALREVERNRFEPLPPLHWPRLYDDVEVPNLFRLEDTWYLLGSIREDIKVHYWYSDKPEGPYRNFSDNVLLPQGNYAARICPRGDRMLVWSFFFGYESRDRSKNVLPPPKELHRNGDGQLSMRSFSGFDQQVESSRGLEELTPLRQLMSHSEARAESCSAGVRLGCPSGVSVFLMQGSYESFRMRGRLTMEGKGKCGLVFRQNEKGDGYLLSLDIFKGLAQLRAWGDRRDGGFDRQFRYETLQAGFYVSDGTGSFDFELVTFGKYLEFSLNGEILLTLVDDTYHAGSAGFYTESALLRVENLELQSMRDPSGDACQPLL